MPDMSPARARPDKAGAVYRPDVDGLRAVAVIAVILFHAELAPFTGGFVGVDIFFVISGYLITRLIMNDMDRDGFSFRRFYTGRVKRLFPALFAMIAVTLLVGIVLLLPRDLASLGRNIAGTTMFLSNFFFWEQAGYFEGDAHYKPLLHTWSLAVEEQFYIVYPLILVLLRRWWPGYMRQVLGWMAFASFFASVAMMRIDASGAFYLTPFRMWELLLGALLALRAVPPLSRRTAEVASLAGFAAIGCAIFLYSDLTPFPGASALVPCLGCALVIHAGENARPALNRLLSWRPVVLVGLTSYSVYLWHWPIFVYVRYYAIEELTTVQSLLVLLLCLVVGGLSWRFIERPFRTMGGVRVHVPVFRWASLAMIASIFAGGAIFAAKGLPDRFPEKTRRLSSYALSMNPESDICAKVDLQLEAHSPCTIGRPDQARLFLWGDSHAGSLFGAMEQLAKEGQSTVYGATPRCPPLLGLGTDADCVASNQRRLDYVLDHPEIHTVILMARWSLYLQGRLVEGTAETNDNLPHLIDAEGREYEPFSREAGRHFRFAFYSLVKRLLVAGKRVVLVYPVPETGYDIPSTLARISSQGGDPASFTISRALYDKRQSQALGVLDQLGRQRGLRRVYPEDALCDRKGCMTSANGLPLYFDSHHLSIPGARLLLPQIRSAIQ